MTRKLGTVFQSTLPVRGATRPEVDLCQAQIFQSTLPVRGATDLIALGIFACVISIHAPREGSDDIGPQGPKGDQGISIHAPREGSDREQKLNMHVYMNFNPRSP